MGKKKRICCGICGMFLLLGVVGLVLGLVLMPYPYHASCSIEWNFSSTCNQVSDHLEAQMKAWEGDALCPNVSDTCPKMPCGQKCLYKVRGNIATGQRHNQLNAIVEAGRRFSQEQCIFLHNFC